jgi:aspartyl/asparaginyl beta-hydroxylase (cupin superfamily)
VDCKCRRGAPSCPTDNLGWLGLIALGATRREEYFVPPPIDLSQLVRAGVETMGRGDAEAARLLFERVIRDRPGDEAAWWGLALACRDLGDETGQLAALDRVLAGNPGHLRALIMKADHFFAAGDGRAAGAFYRAAVDRAPPLDSLPSDLREAVRRAEHEAGRLNAAYERHLLEALAQAGLEPRAMSGRGAAALDLLLGRRVIYQQAPTSFYFPELPQRQFYERDEFPWLAELEAHTDDIIEELLAIVGHEGAFRPYVQSDASRPPRYYGDLLDSLDWSAFYLIRNGEVVADAAARCPRTMAALSNVPLASSPGRTPAVLFSSLRPGARIPPHTGYTNARLICHLPLITPEGCALRVGADTRTWTAGRALIFDDSIEHEAWNDSDRIRVVLLFDIWRPELSAEERQLVAALLSAVGSFGGGDWT